MFIRKLLLGLTVIITAGEDAAAESRAFYGAGTISCGQWQQYRTTGDKGKSFQVEAWIDGYLSGLNVASTDRDFLANKPSNVAIYIWIDNYCRDRPLDAIALAVSSLKNELAARAR